MCYRNPEFDKLTGKLGLTNTCKNTVMQGFPYNNSPSYPDLWTLISITLLDVMGHGLTNDNPKEAQECPPGHHCTNAHKLTSAVSSLWSIQKGKHDNL